MARGKKSVAEHHDLPVIHFVCECEDRRHHLTPADLATRLDSFVRGTRDAGTLHCCLSCLRLLVNMLQQCPAALEAAKAHPTKPFTVALRLLGDLTRVSVPHVRKMLDDEQELCKAAHRSLAKVRHDVFEGLVETLGQFVVGGITGGERPAEAYELFAKRVRWPASVEDLSPGGVARTIDALVFWCCAESGVGAWAVLAFCVQLARDAMLPRLLASENRDRIAWAMLQALSRTPVSWHAATPPLHPPAGFRPLTAARGRPDSVDSVCGLLTVVGTRGAGGTADLARLVAGLAPEFLAAVDGVQPILATFSHTRQEFMLSFCALLSAPTDAPQPAAPTARLVYHFTCRARRPGQPGECGNVACGARAGPGGQKLFFCSTCMLVRYCGRECQRHDWSRAAVPHKHACASLAKLRARIPGTYDWEDFQSGWEKAELDNSEVENLRNWVLATGIVSADDSL